MPVGRTVLAQLIDHIPPCEFHKCVERYRGPDWTISCPEAARLAVQLVQQADTKLLFPGGAAMVGKTISHYETLSKLGEGGIVLPG